MLTAVVIDKKTSAVIPENSNKYLSDSMGSFGDLDSHPSTPLANATLPPTPPTLQTQSSMHTVYKGSVGCAVTPKLKVSEVVVVVPKRTTVCCAAVLLWLCCVDIEREQDE